MELRFVSTGTVDFITRVDKKVWFELGHSKDFKPFPVAEHTVVGAERFDCRDWVSLPNDGVGNTVPVQPWSDLWEVGEYSCEVFGVGCGLFS